MLKWDYNKNTNLGQITNSDDQSYAILTGEVASTFEHQYWEAQAEDRQDILAHQLVTAGVHGQRTR